MIHLKVKKTPALSTLSLLLCLATAVLWVRSYAVADFYDWRGQERGFELLSSGGRFALMPYRVLRHNQYSFVGYHHVELDGLRWDDFAPSIGVHLGSFAAGPTNTGVLDGYCLILPYWSVFLATAALPAWRFFSSRRARTRTQRLRNGLCARCGYDLRASHDRCPECGAKAEA